MNYEEYVNKEIQNLMVVQDFFKRDFDIDSYENWFYDSTTSLLRLYNDDSDEIFFRYIPVGTYNQDTKTWMWSWDNADSREPNKNEALKIKEFGLENGFEALHQGYFKADELDCWEFVALCNSFSNGIGAYRAKTDNLEMYLLITAHITNTDSTEIVSLKQKTVDCAGHGFNRPAFVCQHLNLEIPKGFEEAFATEKDMVLDEDQDFNAWCDDCEKVRVEHDGWNDASESFAGIKLICEECYFQLKEFNLPS